MAPMEQFGATRPQRGDGATLVGSGGALFGASLAECAGAGTGAERAPPSCRASGMVAGASLDVAPASWLESVGFQAVVEWHS
jgi:hypothetical protein